MGGVATLAQTLSDVLDQLTLGFAMFGDHAIWLIMLPFFWSIATCLIWIKVEKDEEERDSRYIANAERNLPKLRELTKQRSTETLEVRAINRDVF